MGKISWERYGFHVYGILLSPAKISEYEIGKFDQINLQCIWHDQTNIEYLRIKNLGQWGSESYGD